MKNNLLFGLTFGVTPKYLGNALNVNSEKFIKIWNYIISNFDNIKIDELLSNLGVEIKISQVIEVLKIFFDEEYTFNEFNEDFQINDEYKQISYLSSKFNKDTLINEQFIMSIISSRYLESIFKNVILPFLPLISEIVSISIKALDFKTLSYEQRLDYFNKSNLINLLKFDNSVYQSFQRSEIYLFFEGKLDINKYIETNKKLQAILEILNDLFFKTNEEII